MCSSWPRIRHQRAVKLQKLQVYRLWTNTNNTVSKPEGALHFKIPRNIHIITKDHKNMKIFYDKKRPFRLQTLQPLVSFRTKSILVNLFFLFFLITFIFHKWNPCSCPFISILDYDTQYSITLSIPMALKTMNH